MDTTQEHASTQEEQNIEDIDVSEEMRESFLEYAYSVIYARALPDARDGLKPVQRRILYQMHRMGLTPQRGHVKSQRVVGEVMGKLHPHGDAPIYDALVRLAQDFNLRLPLVDGHGNFGSLDDGPAAARYTEARLAQASLFLMHGLDEDGVDFVPNYDNQFLQPEVLPVDFPALLVNGASGIAVGMATSIAPHNPAETLRGALALLRNPQISLPEMMSIIPGPDFPGGGIIPGLDGVKQAYETGRGTFKVRGKVAKERISARKNGLVVTELPYMVGPERLIERIKDAVKTKKITGISAVTNLTDRHHGLRVVIEIKSGFNPDSVLDLLYSHTPLEETFAFNGVALVDGQPRTMPLLDMLDSFLEHRISVEKRVLEFTLARRKERLHLVQGLLLAILDIDDVIAIIRGADDTDIAKVRLQEAFDLSEVQADYILQLRLRRLTKLSTLALSTEKEELEKEIGDLEEILASDQALRDHVGHRLEEVAGSLDSPRRTVLLDAPPADPAAKVAEPSSLEIKDEPCVVVLTPGGSVAALHGEQAPAQDPNSDGATSWAATTTRGECMVVTADGTGHRLQVESLPLLARSESAQSLAGAVPVAELIGATSKAVGVFPLDGDHLVTLGTALGSVKRVRPDWPVSRDDWTVMSLEDDDEIVGGGLAGDTDYAVFVTREGRLLKFEVDTVRPQGPAGGGVRGIRLPEGDRCIFFAPIPKDEETVVVTVTEPEGSLEGTVPGSAKLSLLDDYPTNGRGSMGVRTHRFLKGESHLRLGWVGNVRPRARNAKHGTVELPDEFSKRDASGSRISGVIEYVL